MPSALRIIDTPDGYTTAALAGIVGTSGQLARVTDGVRGIWMYDTAGPGGSAWRHLAPEGVNPGGGQRVMSTWAIRRLKLLDCILEVPGPTTPGSPSSEGVVGIGTRQTAVGFNLDVTLNSSASAIGMSLTPTLKPSIDGTFPGGISGHAHALKLAPIIHVNEFSQTGDNNVHKWLSAAWVEMPTLVLTTPDYATGEGLPQEVFGVRVANTAVLEPKHAHRGCWAFHGEVLPSRLGAVMIGSGALGGLYNIRPDAADWKANAIRIDALISPLSDVNKNPQRDAWSIHSLISILTEAGQYDDLGNAYFLTPVNDVGSVGSPILRTTTLRVGNAPAWGTTARALWVGTGRTHIEGDLLVGDALRLGGITVTSGVGAGDLVLPNATGQILFQNTALTGTNVALRDSSNRLAIGEGYTEVILAASFLRFNEVTAPSAASANEARLFCRDNGSGKTQLCAIFNTGAIQVLATEP